MNRQDLALQAVAVKRYHAPGCLSEVIHAVAHIYADRPSVYETTCHGCGVDLPADRRTT